MLCTGRTDDQTDGKTPHFSKIPLNFSIRRASADGFWVPGKTAVGFPSKESEKFLKTLHETPNLYRSISEHSMPGARSGETEARS